MSRWQVPVPFSRYEVYDMANCKVTLTKKSARAKMAAKPSKAAGDAAVIQDNQDNTATVFGVDAAGAQVDISAVATLAVTSSDPAVVTADPPAGATFGFHGVAPGKASFAITATWNDGSIGPFNIDLPVEVTGGPSTGLVVVLGTPTSRP